MRGARTVAGRKGSAQGEKRDGERGGRQVAAAREGGDIVVDIPRRESAETRGYLRDALRRRLARVLYARTRPRVGDASASDTPTRGTRKRERPPSFRDARRPFFIAFRLVALPEVST